MNLYFYYKTSKLLDKFFLDQLSNPSFKLFLNLKAFEFLGNSFKISLEWVKIFMKFKLDLFYKTTTITISKQPPNWEDQRTKMAHRVAYFIMPYNVLALLSITCINMDSPYTSKHMKKMGKKGIKGHTCFIG
jgi:hypothetical protein